MERGKPPFARRGLLIAGAITVLLGLAWVTWLGDWYLWNVAPISARPSVRRNMHDVQLAVVDFAIEHDNRYPNTSVELAPYARRLRLRNPFTKLPLGVIVRRGPLAERDTVCVAGSVVVERPDSASYVICGCDPRGRWMEFQLRNDRVLPE
jgi:hypothetical protein